MLSVQAAIDCSKPMQRNTRLSRWIPSVQVTYDCNRTPSHQHPSPTPPPPPTLLKSAYMNACSSPMKTAKGAASCSLTSLNDSLTTLRAANPSAPSWRTYILILSRPAAARTEATTHRPEYAPASTVVVAFGSTR